MTPGICFICESNTTFLITKFGYRLTQCPACKLVSMDPQPTTAELSALYSADSGYHTHFSKKYIDAQTKKFSDRIIGTQEILSRKNLTCFDIGAANGLFLDTAKQLGLTTAGIEMNEVNAKLCRDNGHDVVTGTIDTFTFTEKYDLIHLGDVLEHMIDPRTVIQKVKHALTTNGIVIIALPNASGLFQRASLRLAKFFSIDWPHPLPPAHTFQFSRNNLDLLLSSEDLLPVKHSYLNTSFMAEMRDTIYFQTIYNFIKQKKGTLSLFLMHATMFVLIGCLYFPFWLIGHLHYAVTNHGSYVTVWYQNKP